MWPGRTAVPVSVPPSHSAAQDHRLCNTPTLDIPKASTPHNTPPKAIPSLSLSSVKENSLNHSLQALKWPEDSNLWLLSMGPNMIIGVSDLSLDQWGKDGESLSHQELMTALQWCSSAVSCCFEAYLWLPGLPQGQAGAGIFMVTAQQTPPGSCRWSG